MNTQIVESSPFSEAEKIADLSSSLGIHIPEVEGDYHKLSQEAYDAGLAIVKSKELDFYEIGHFYDVSDIKLDESIPHKFSGFNVVGRVPRGSEIGDNSVIHSGTDLNNCTIKNSVQAGDDVHLSNCRIGNHFEAGTDVFIKNCTIGSRFTAIRILKIDNTTIGMMFSAEHVDNLANENVLAPSHNINSISKIGNNNQIIGEDPMPGFDELGLNNKRIALTVDDIDEIVYSKDLKVSANKMAQKNGFEALNSPELQVNQDVEMTVQNNSKLKI